MADRRSRRRPMWLALVVALYVLGVILVWLGSADAPIDTRSSAFWYRTLRAIPGLTDVCGDFTWGARLLPAFLPGVGTVVAFAHHPRSRFSILAAALGLALAASIAFATTQNAIPLGELHCIID